VTELILQSIVSNNMYESMNKIVENKLKISRGLAHRRRKVKNMYHIEDPYVEFDDKKVLGLEFKPHDNDPTDLEVCENDIIEEMINQNKTSTDVISMIARTKSKEACDRLFILFMLKRKYMLINYLFTKCKVFQFDYHLFIMCLENDAYDIAVLLYQNFESYFFESDVRDNVVPHLLNAFNKATNMIEAKCYLLKKYITYFNASHCKRLLDIYEYKLLNLSRSHALVGSIANFYLGKQRKPGQDLMSAD